MQGGNGCDKKWYSMVVLLFGTVLIFESWGAEIKQEEGMGKESRKCRFFCLAGSRERPCP